MIHHLKVGPSTSHTRDLEWVAALIMLALSVVLMVPGDSLSAPQFAEFHVLGLGESFWTGFFGLIGGTRVIALWINGRSPRTPLFRTAGALIGLAIWVQMFIMLRAGAIATWGAETMGEAPYGMLAIFEAVSIVRASFDARYVSRRR